MREDLVDLRTDVVDLRTDLTDLRASVDTGFIEIRGKLDATATGQHQIVTLLKHPHRPVPRRSRAG